MLKKVQIIVATCVTLASLTVALAAHGADAERVSLQAVADSVVVSPSGTVDMGSINVNQPALSSGWLIPNQAGFNSSIRIELRHTGADSDDVEVQDVLIEEDPDGDFTSIAPGLPAFVLPPGGDQTLYSFRLGFKPETTGAKSARLRVVTDQGDLEIPLSGRGVGGSTLYRVNSGGPILHDADRSRPSFVTDTFGNKSAYMVGNNHSTGPVADHPVTLDSTVTGSTPGDVFQKWRVGTGGIQYAFPIAQPGSHVVRVHFAELFEEAANRRKFDVAIEGSIPLRQFDPFAEAGYRTGTSQAFRVVADERLDLTVSEGVGSPVIQGIEIIDINDTTEVPASVNGSDFGTVAVGGEIARQVTITNTGGATSPAFRLDDISLSGPGAADYENDFSGSVWISPGDSRVVNVSFSPSQTGDRSVAVTAQVWGAPALSRNFTASGSATAGTLTVPASLEFDAVKVGETADRTLILENSSGAALFIGDAQVIGSEAFSVVGEPFPITISPNGSAEIDLRFAPTTSADTSATLRIEHTGTNRPSNVELSGDGTARFTDTAGSIFEDDIEWMALVGITRGCNPPDNSRFCPDDNVTRGQMAAFFVRGLNLTFDAGDDHFSDDDGSTFESDVNRMATAGITRGCNPPDNTRFCPGEFVTRGQMAAFFVRALGLQDDGGGNQFSDDDGSTFESDIDRMATAGITRGCNPPENTRFCPGDFVTRGQMAAFFHRAAELIGLGG